MNMKSNVNVNMDVNVNLNVNVYVNVNLHVNVNLNLNSFIISAPHNKCGTNRMFLPTGSKLLTSTTLLSQLM